ncbi:MAG TPA: transcriptional repressor [Mycobacteriales bacterium]|jgi:Fur family ferric uptake transcriptional regulator/Fur family peroxide stress response transcriptional regulator|nr:transcriptional repressor [Mycobacteriales bacterium]
MTTSSTRSTPQRRAVLQAVSQSDDHPTAAEVLDRVSEILPGVGAATIYRTLAMLVESGQILELRVGQSPMRYDRNIERHDHLICNNCGRVIDVELPLDRRRSIDPLEARHDFRVTSYDLRVHGECADCRASLKKGKARG